MPRVRRPLHHLRARAAARADHRQEARPARAVRARQAGALDHHALRKRPVEPERIERMITGIVRRSKAWARTRFPSTQIGELVMQALRASTRWPMSASPRSTNFRETQDFEEFISDLAERPPSRTEPMMRAALALARRSLGQTWPNPAVGCVIVRDGAVLARGRHAGGRPAARRSRCDRASDRRQPRKAQRFLSRSSPAAHHGRTPPCADALVAAGVARVVSALEDPDPRVSGAGHRPAARGRYRGRGGRRRARSRRDQSPASCCGWPRAGRCFT